MRREDEQRPGRRRHSDHWVYLDRWWAQRLGVKWTAGMYQIRSRDLGPRLSHETLSMKASHGFAKKAWIIPVMLGYGGAFVLLGIVLAQGVAVGVAYGIWAAEVTWSPFLGVFCFEILSFGRWRSVSLLSLAGSS